MLARAASDKPRRWKVVLAFALIYIVWGSTFLAIRYAVQTIPPFLMMGLRHVTAGAIVFSALWFRGEARTSPRMWSGAIVSALFLFIGSHGVLAWAEQYVPSGLAALLVSTEPLVMVLMARMLGQEKHISARTIVGLVAGVAGVALLFGTPGLENKFATAAVLFSAVAWAVGAIYARDKTGPSVMTSAAIQMFVGGVMLLIVGFAMGERLHPSTITARSALSLAYLSIFGSVLAFTAYTWLLQVTTAARVGTHAYVNPVIAVILGGILGREPLSWRMFAGAAVIIGSVLLVNKSDAAKSVMPERELAAD